METYLSSNSQITFSRNVYRRYTDFISFNRTYDVKNTVEVYSDTKPNTVRVENFDYSIINEITLDIHDIKNVKDVEIYVEKQKGNTQTVFPDRTTLYTVSGTFLEKVCKKSSTLYSLKNAICNNYPLFLIDRAKYDFFITINYIKPVPKEYLCESVTVRYSKLLSQEERSRFDKISHEYLIKTHKYIKYDLVEGNNVISLKGLKNKCLELVYLNFELINVLNSGRLIIGDTEIPDILVDNTLTRHHPLTYTLDPGHNTQYLEQPGGHYKFTENTVLELNVSLASSVYITYVEYDVLILSKADNGGFDGFCQYILSEETEHIKRLFKQIEIPKTIKVGGSEFIPE